MPPQRRIHARRYADDQREKRRGKRKLERCRKTLLEQRRYGAPLTERQPELTVHGTRDKTAELNEERLGETQIGGQPGAIFLRRILSHHERHGVAREIEQPEGDERHHHHYGERLQNAAEDESEHVD